MDRGYTKFYRKITESECFRDAYEFKAFFWLVNEANYEDKRWGGRLIKRGQKLTSIRKMSAILDMSDRTIQRVLKKLVGYGSIRVKADKKGGSLITIINYDTYQSSVVNSTTQCTTQCTTQDTTLGTTQSTTKQEIKELKNNISTTTHARDSNFEIDKQSILKGYLSDEDWLYSKSEEVMIPVEQVVNCVQMFMAQIRNNPKTDDSTSESELQEHLTRWMRRNKSITLINNSKINNSNNGRVKAKYGFQNESLQQYKAELSREFESICKDLAVKADVS